jgi:hypothetical protein
MWRIRVVAAAVLATGVIGCASLAAANAARAVSQPPCRHWSVRTIASGLGVLENLEPDGRGAMLLSNNGANQIDRLTPDGAVSTLISGVSSPGGERVRGPYLYFNTGDSTEAGVLGTNDGTIQRYDLRSGTRVTWSTGLYMPNGLIFLPNGDAAVSRVSAGTGLTRIGKADPAHPEYRWVDTNDSNGLALDPTGSWIYWDQTFQPGNDVMRARISAPREVEVVASLGEGLVLDDMTVDRNGILYIASNRPAPLGEVIRLDPYTKQQCVIASGLSDPSAVKFGCGPGWAQNHLYAVGFGGSVYDISPPAASVAPRGTCDAIAIPRRRPPAGRRGKGPGCTPRPNRASRCPGARRRRRSPARFTG